MFGSGLWRGRCFGQSGTEDGDEKDHLEMLCWTLALTSRGDQFPSVYGATADGCILAGSLQLREHSASLTTVSEITMRCSHPMSPDIISIYQGVVTTIDSDDGTSRMSIRGSHRSAGDIYRRFEVSMSEDTALAGEFYGMAVPSQDLADFMIPHNPIRWCLSVDDGKAFGAGFFDDAGRHSLSISSLIISDVPDKSTLLFSIMGEQEGQNISLRKTYELCEQTEGVSVEYHGQIFDENGGILLKGEWSNASSGAYGQFNCRRVGGGRSSDLCGIFCSICFNPLLVGQQIQTCYVCETPRFDCCAGCSLGSSHPHQLHSEVVLKPKVAIGRTCAEVVLESFSLFSDQPLLLPSGSGPSLTYAEVHHLVQQVCSSELFANLSALSAVILIGHLSVRYVAVLLACVVKGFVVIPVDPRLPSDQMAMLAGRVDAQLIIVGGGGDDDDDDNCGDSQHSTTGAAARCGIPCVSVGQLLEFGLSRSAATLLKPLLLPPDPTRTVAILFTSGSTGLPKGAVYSERLALPSSRASNMRPPLVKLDLQQFHPSFLISLLSVMSVGGQRALCLNKASVLADMARARPTHVSAPPAFFDAIYHRYFIADDRNAAAKEIRSSFGNRLTQLATGGSCVSPDVLHFFRHRLRLPLDDLYGSRETGPIAKNGQVYESVQVMQDPQSMELLVHSPRLIDSYFNDVKTTNQLFFEHQGKRWYRTGDVARLSTDSAAGRTMVQLLGRCKSTVKLANSRWLAPEPIEKAIECLPQVGGALVVARTQYTFPVAIVSLSSEEGADDSADDARVRHDIQCWLTHQHVRDIPVRVHVERNLVWSPENGFLTSTMKKKRQAICDHYATIIDDLFSNTGSVEEEEEAVDDTAPLSDTLVKLLRPIIGDGVPFHRSHTLAQLGANSFIMAQIKHAFYSQFSLTLHFEHLFSFPLSHLDALVQVDGPLRAQISETRSPMTNNSIDWLAEMELGPPVLPLSHSNTGSDIFVTGASGFLGVGLIRQLRADLPSSSLLYCLIRPSSVAKFKSLAFDASTVIPIEGDLSDPESSWLRLIPASVNSVYHVGAIVNLIYPYRSLKAVNVNATRRLLRWAVAKKVHHFVYASSVSVFSADPSDSLREAGLHVDMRLLGQMGGYGSSKVICEHLISEAATRYPQHTKFHVFRISSIIGDTAVEQPTMQHKAGCNSSDFSILLLKTIKSIGGCPLDSPMKLQWVPRDFVCQAMVRLVLLGDEAPVGRQHIVHLISSQPSLSHVLHTASGYSGVEDWSLSKWRKEVNELQPHHPAFSLKDVLLSLHFQDKLLPVSTSNSNRALRGVGLPSLDHFSEEYFSRQKLDHFLSSPF